MPTTEDTTGSAERRSRLRTVVWSIVGAAAIVVVLAGLVGVGIVGLWTHDSGPSDVSDGVARQVGRKSSSNDLTRWNGIGKDLAAGRKVTLRVSTTLPGLGLEASCQAPRGVTIKITVDGEPTTCGGGSMRDAAVGPHAVTVSAAHADGAAYEVSDGALRVSVFLFEADPATTDGS